jgi:hypothetical protein
LSKRQADSAMLPSPSGLLFEVIFKVLLAKELRLVLIYGTAFASRGGKSFFLQCWLVE